MKPVKAKRATTDKPVKITLAGQTIRGKVYGVGPCWVRLGHGPQVAAVAVKAGKEKHIGDRAHVILWLAERGLDVVEAEQFVDEGLAQHDQ